MARWVKYSLLPAAVAFAAFFSVLPRTGADATIEMVGARGSFSYSPDRLEVERGARVAFVNRTDATHTATCSSCPPGDAWDTGDVQPGQTEMIVFREDARYEFFCRYHGRTEEMTGVLIVGSPPASPSPSPTPTA